MQDWRLILSPPLDGLSNMAVDEAFFNLQVPPTLRFYSWLRPTVSVGRFQRIDRDFSERCRGEGLHIVRRPTGGRAILHDNELTYSICAPYDKIPHSSTLKDLFALLATWQIDSLARLGVEASLAGGKWSGRSYAASDACFLSSTSCEVAVGGKKIAGSAQRRGRDFFLQHGSILIDYDPHLFSRLFGQAPGEQHFSSLKNEDCHAAQSEIRDVMAEEFERIMGCRLVESLLSEEERREISRLEKDLLL